LREFEEFQVRWIREQIGLVEKGNKFEPTVSVPSSGFHSKQG